ncbi:winged helix-turn-helix domain-containing protein [Vibrio ouci]|uniref:CadC family transcriptional regulator n=1 Tax=Vibrio ouci TaxID=2499078 RepID=A0A4Y8W915_9VIBR|nr:winged helix-turn-helix domain-containing protein [Vibrio ouci]TFH89432.1 CadC family transcriptional regulator [Vibrio ouci]
MVNIECNRFSCAFCNEAHIIKRMLNVSVKSSKGKMFILTTDGRGQIGCSQNAIRALCYLCQNKDTLVSKSDIEEFVWQGGIVGMSSLPVLIHEVRNLLKATDFEVVTIRNKGFIFYNAKQKVKTVQNDIIAKQIVNT